VDFCVAETNEFKVATNLPAVRLRGSAAPTNKKGRLLDGLFDFPKRGSSRCWRDDWRGGGFPGLGRFVFAFDVAVPATSIFNFVVLSAHNSLLCSRVAVLWCAI
jgi:hypothetical protein